MAPDIEIAIPETGFEAGQDIQLFVAIEYLRGEYDPNRSTDDESSQSESEAGTEQQAGSEE